MPGVELGLAVIATVDLCFKYGKTLIEMCASFKNAESEIAQRALSIKGHWKRTTLQLEFFQRVCRGLDEELLDIQDEILQVLISKLNIAISKIERCTKKSKYPVPAQGQQALPLSIKRWKYVLLKESLDKAIEDIKEWQRLYDPSWFLIMKVTSPQIDAALASGRGNPNQTILSALSLRHALHGDIQNQDPIFLPNQGLEWAQVMDLDFSSAKLARRADSPKWLILDSITYPPQAEPCRATEDVRDLARRLRRADPVAFGLLKCKGVVKVLSTQDEQLASFTFVFRTPEGLSQPRSLRRGLLSGDAGRSLSDRFKIAKELAQSVGYIHTFGFVHKSIRPETILTFASETSSLGSCFLVGFENFRTADLSTLRLGDSAWEKELYRHPCRQGLTPTDKYIMQHDIYSLGVCLLELGLWDSFVTYDQDRMNPSPSPALLLLPEAPEFGDAFLMKSHLISLTRSALPKRMGTRYSEVVETCLTCLDEDNVDFGDECEFQDQDGILIGVRYIEKVTSLLQHVESNHLIIP